MEEILNTLNKKLDPRAKNTLGFLINKGLLWTNQPIEAYVGKINILDAIWTAENIEPRVYEVLPAALIHFPKTFIGLKNLPEELFLITKAIKAGKTPEKEEWNGIKTKNMAKWANNPLKDKERLNFQK
jgi:hypothetical protein